MASQESARSCKPIFNYWLFSLNVSEEKYGHVAPNRARDWDVEGEICTQAQGTKKGPRISWDFTLFNFTQTATGMLWWILLQAMCTGPRNAYIALLTQFQNWGEASLLHQKGVPRSTGTSLQEV